MFGPVLEKLSEESGPMTWSQITFAAAKLAEEEKPSRYRHVLVDESQDFGPAELTFSRALVEPATDDLFLCGDAGQRIFRRHFSWSNLGISTQGRSRHLSSNYRNTQEIERFARRVLRGSPIGGDGEEEERDSVSLLTGAEPVVRICKDE